MDLVLFNINWANLFIIKKTRECFSICSADAIIFFWVLRKLVFWDCLCATCFSKYDVSIHRLYSNDSRYRYKSTCFLFGWSSFIQWKKRVSLIYVENVSCCCWCYCWGFSAKGLPESGPCELQRHFRVGGKGLEGWRRNMYCLFVSSLGHLRSQCSIACGSSLRRGHRGSAEGSRRLA